MNTFALNETTLTSSRQYFLVYYLESARISVTKFKTHVTNNFTLNATTLTNSW